MKVLPAWKKSAAAGVLALPLILSGCSFLGAGPSPSIDAPPEDVEQQMLNGETPTSAQVAHDPASLTTVYLENGQGLLAPVSLPLDELGAAAAQPDAAGDSQQNASVSEDSSAAADSSAATDDKQAAQETGTQQQDNAVSTDNPADASGTSGAAAANDDGLAADTTAPAVADDNAQPAAGTVDTNAENSNAADAKAADPGASNNDLVKDLETLVKDGPYQSELPSGFTGVLPAGTKVNAVTLNQDKQTAVVEFSKEFNKYDAKDERKILEAVTWTLTEQDGVNAVEVWVDGQRLNEMPVGHTPIPSPLNRAVGINLELSGGSVSQTTPVTVYFTATSDDGDPYYVPVTRFVPSGQDPLKAALGQLIQGPAQGDGLEQVLTETASVKSVNTSKDGVINVALNDDMFENGDKLPAQMLEAVVLTLTENAKGSKVSITFNDNKDVVDTDNQNYSDPVTRPEKINDLSV